MPMLLGVQLAFPDPPLAAAGFVLRRLEADDASWIAAACNDRELSRYTAVIPYPYSLADARSFIQFAARSWAEGTGATFAVGRDPGGDGLGAITLKVNAADPVMAEVGYWLCKQARGRGIAATAVRLVSGWAFEKLGVKRLNLTTAVENVASQRVAENAGFTREGLLRAWTPTVNGRRDSLMFSLLPKDLPRAAGHASAERRRARPDQLAAGERSDQERGTPGS